MPVVLFNEPLHLPDKLPPRPKAFASTKDKVYEAKYGIALMLAHLEVDFVFFEMDCFILQHPMHAVRSHWISDADMYISLHQDNPFEFNVGYYIGTYPHPPHTPQHSTHSTPHTPHLGVSVYARGSGRCGL